MSNPIPPGTTGIRRKFKLLDDGGLALDGKNAASLPDIYYNVTGAASVKITLVDLTAATDPWTSGGVWGLGRGEYSIDVPNAAFAAAALEVTLSGEATGMHVLCEPIKVGYVQSDVEQWKGSTAPANTGDTFARLGAPAGASIAADIAANLVAVQNVQNNTFIATTIPSTLERPDSGSVTVSISITFSDETGTAKNLDSGNPAITLVNDAGTSLASRLGAFTNPATGKYVVPYTSSASDAIEGLHWDITGTVNGKLRRMVAYTQIVDTTAVDFTSSDRTNLNTVVTTVSSISTIVSAIQTVLSGITSLAQWLGAFAGKQAANATALNEIKSTGAGSGTFDPTTDSLEALGATVDALSGITGSGAFTITLTVTDGTNPIENASVRMVSGGQHFIGTTDVSGHITFNLNAATWTVAITAVGFSFSGASLVVAGDTTHTYAMTAITITPSNPGLTTGFLTCYDQNGAVESGVTITATLVQAGSSDAGHSYDNTAVTKTSDVNGLVQFPNLILGATYRFTRGTSTKVYSITIPTAAGASYALPSIIGAP